MKIQRFCSAALLAIALQAAPALAQSPAKLVPAQSEVAFVTKQMGVPVDGRFKKFDAQINLDPKKPEAGSVAFSIDTGSASAGRARERRRDAQGHLVQRRQVPAGHLQVHGHQGPGQRQVRGRRQAGHQGHRARRGGAGADHAVGRQSTATGSFVIKRLDFKIGEAEWTDTTVVANDVTVKFKLALTGLGPL